VLLEISLIFHLLVGNFSVFFDLVVVDVEWSCTNGLFAKIVLCDGGLIWGLEANEGIDVLSGIVLEHLKAFNITKFRET